MSGRSSREPQTGQGEGRRTGGLLTSETPPVAPPGPSYASPAGPTPRADGVAEGEGEDPCHRPGRRDEGRPADVGRPHVKGADTRRRGVGDLPTGVSLTNVLTPVSVGWEGTGRTVGRTVLGRHSGQRESTTRTATTVTLRNHSTQRTRSSTHGRGTTRNTGDIRNRNSSVRCTETTRARGAPPWLVD